MKHLRELVVISGKGGTGKTSLVACFAALYENKVLADCDVDAANLHLVMDTQILHREPFMGGKKAGILADRCNGCGDCKTVCRFDAVTADGHANGSDRFRIDPIACEGCGVCTLVCTADAIEFEEVVSGEWFVSETRHGPMVHAKLGIAEGNSGKLVSIVRSQARGIAVAQGLDMVLIDGPPGIGCPVIASITGTDLVLIVTEPTLSGLHDLERVRQLVSHFKITTVACINKCDLNPDMSSRIERYCRENGIEIVGRIPYDNVVTSALIQGTSVVEYSNGPTSEKISHMWEQVQEMLEINIAVGRRHSGWTVS